MRLHFGGRGCDPHEQARSFHFVPRGFHFEFGGPSRGNRGGGSGWGGDDDRPRGRRRMFGSGELRLVLLKLIADEPRHGYDLIRAIEEMTEGQYAPSPGVVYPTLTMLTDMGMTEEQASEGARKAYAITAAGTAHLAENADEIEALFERLEEAKPEGPRHGKHEIGRAIGNLMTAMRHRVAREGFDEALVHEVTAILDEAAQRIERLK